MPLGVLGHIVAKGDEAGIATASVEGRQTVIQYVTEAQDRKHLDQHPEP